MKYEGTRPSKVDKDFSVYTFTVGKEELEILVKLIQRTYENTPDVVEIMQYRSRLRNLTKNFGKVWVEVVQGNTMSLKRPYTTIRRNLNS